MATPGNSSPPSLFGQAVTFAQGLAAICGIVLLLVGGWMRFANRVDKLDWALTEHLRWTQEDKATQDRRLQSLNDAMARLTRMEEKIDALKEQISRGIGHAQ